MRTFLEAGTVEDVIPEGYIHAFLMRNPKKSVSSINNGTLQGFSGELQKYFIFSRSWLLLHSSKVNGCCKLLVCTSGFEGFRDIYVHALFQSTDLIMWEIVGKFSLPIWLVWITCGLGLKTNVFFSNISIFYSNNYKKLLTKVIWIQMCETFTISGEKLINTEDSVAVN